MRLLVISHWLLVIGITGLTFYLSLSSEITAPPQSNLDYQLYHGIIHLQTPVSGGTRTIADYVALAREHKIKIVIITDQANQSYTYAIHPVRWLVRKSVEKNSVWQFGLERYLNLINQANGDILVIDGVEVIPFYYWTRFSGYQESSLPQPIEDKLTLHNRGRHMLVIGLKEASTYAHMPLLSNGKSHYDAYHGDQSGPYQDLIDYVNQQGGVTFWAHPEASEMINLGNVLLATPPYPQALLDTRDYTGFSIFSDGYQKVGCPGGIWDKVLQEYGEGRRQRPVWAIAELDDYGTKPLDSIQTVFLLKEFSYQAVLNALKSGKMYARSRPVGSRNDSLLVLEEFMIEDSSPSPFPSPLRGEGRERVAYSGDEITLDHPPLIRIKLGGNTGKKVTLKLLRQGRLLKEYNQSLPFNIAYEDTGCPAGKKVYYRLDITDEFGVKVISNPIFVRYKEVVTSQ